MTCHLEDQALWVSASRLLELMLTCLYTLRHTHAICLAGKNTEHFQQLEKGTLSSVHELLCFFFLICSCIIPPHREREASEVGFRRRRSQQLSVGQLGQPGQPEGRG